MSALHLHHRNASVPFRPNYEIAASLSKAKWVRPIPVPEVCRVRCATACSAVLPREMGQREGTEPCMAKFPTRSNTWLTLDQGLMTGSSYMSSWGDPPTYPVIKACPGWLSIWSPLVFRTARPPDALLQVLPWDNATRHTPHCLQPDKKPARMYIFNHPMHCLDFFEKQGGFLMFKQVLPLAHRPGDLPVIPHGFTGVPHPQLH